MVGISWFEAAAYAEFAGKRLPSVYHSRSASLIAAVESIVPPSNFSGKALARVGSYQGMSACGAFDMVGNAKEWCWNEAGPDNRYILGGGWNEPDYMFAQTDAVSPFNRAVQNGFRCIKVLAPGAVAHGVDGAHIPVFRNYANEQPVSDETFRAYRSLYSFDKTPLNARVETTDDSDNNWRKEKISFDAAYGNERMAAYVFVPKNVPAPYQTVIFFPGSGVQRQPSSESLLHMPQVNLVIESGRALVYPIYKGTYERRFGQPDGAPRPSGASANRNWVIQLRQDLGRTIDYLETRREIRIEKLGYLGTSWGAFMGALLPAVEDRIKVNVLIIGGFYPGESLPEADQINFAPRITIPTLMLNGRHDFHFQLEASQEPMFRFLGAPAEHKVLKLFEAGHALSTEQISEDVLGWLDKYLGPVK